MRKYEIVPGQGKASLRLVTVDRPEPGNGEVLIRIRATSLNFRDLLIAGGQYPGSATTAIVPFSDCAGEVVAVGHGVTVFAVGDRVAGIFMQSWVGGGIVDADLASALGGAVDGVLAEYRVFAQHGLVLIPEHLTFEEAAALPCAAVTAWNALFSLRPIQPGQTVLTLGTGGVSMFALQFAKAAGARVIATSSSDEKLERARILGAAETINYRNNPDWDAEARRLTDGRGVDCVVEVGGPGTLARSIAATARDGAVQLIGVLSMASIDPLPILTGGVTVRGVMVGSREMFLAMNRAITTHRILPAIDRSFAFEEVPQAYRHLQSAQYVGKIVVSLQA